MSSASSATEHCKIRSVRMELWHIRKSYGTTIALDDVSLRLDEGMLLALLGLNGAGKTTLINIISGLTEPDGGTVTKSSQLTERGFPAIGFAPQKTGIYLQLTVRQNLEFFGSYSGVARRDLRTRVDEVGDALGLSSLFRRRCDQMSGGEQRRLHLAISLIADPPLLLLDEPTVGADVEGRYALLELVRQLAKNGSTVVYSTHYLDEVEALNGEVAILDKGRLIVHDTIGKVKSIAGGSILEIHTERPCPVLPEIVHKDPAVRNIDHANPEWLRMTTTDPSRKLAQLTQWLVAEGNAILDVKVIEPSVESAFLSLTSRRYEEGSRND